MKGNFAYTSLNRIYKRIILSNIFIKKNNDNAFPAATYIENAAEKDMHVSSPVGAQRISGSKDYAVVLITGAGKHDVPDAAGRLIHDQVCITHFQSGLLKIETPIFFVG